MNILTFILALLLALFLALAGATRVASWLIERRNPPVGSFVDIDGAIIHYVNVPAPAGGDLPPLVFIHGASANLKDQMLPLRPQFEGRAEMLFFDRPGHGWSGRGPGNNETQQGQAATIAALMDRLGIKDAIIVGHSFGGSIAATFALEHPEKTRGLLFLSAATHPWPGGGTSWYYSLSALPVVGRAFAETIANPAGLMRIGAATTCVFSPNKVPDLYVDDAAIKLVLRPRAFRANAIDVEGLYRHVLVAAPRYPTIEAPTVVISGDHDTVVYEEIHSIGLARDIPAAELVWVKNLGHKPDWVAPDLVVAAVEKLAGQPRDLQALSRAVEARITGDDFGTGVCWDEKAPANSE
ncbi:2-hydroxy-6-oxononadienedioate/2-hydroxy-6-oxononatrienedioate hydrolase [Aminobacter sp. MSH1]|uniref:alpha/beta fold hydrolase n=1 Tax=Aminobacter sp. MSH1 TaxID=374606 RepID=UPI000D3AC1AC|nr:alpha/beta hydrolase [Aminobacter sp. MSH1]AWC21967.1 2-hydroxy-6-oxononadienedioate/2-hydroxy-6-oxononatrienedioate hydrolase [Aminobacter sp. MSH1]